MKQLFVALAILFATTTPAYTANENSLPPVQTVNSVDLKQYLGRWYEIAAIPQSFEKQCVGNTMAEYSLAEEDMIAVVNSCDTSTGQPSVATGRAKVVDGTANSQLKVTFVHFFGWQFVFSGDYWILALGENYSYAVVGAPGRDYAWILSRTPRMKGDQLLEATQALMDQGFDSCKLITTIQDSGLQKRTSLCKLISRK